MNRCYNENAKDYLHGIAVAQRWHDYANFLKDLGPRPSTNHTLTRQDETKDFEPGNVIWWERHNKTKSRVYGIWKGMLARTGNMGKAHAARDASIKHYIGRGIDVVEEWLKFENFLADMGEPPTDKHTLDRINNDEGYGPANCRWATRKEQARNTSVARMLTLNGETRCASEWAEILGMPVARVHSRLRLGWTDPAKILSVEKFSNRDRKVARIDEDGCRVIFDSPKEAARMSGLGYAAVSKCLSGGNITCGGYKWQYV